MDRAEALIKAGRSGPAVQAFALARALSVNLPPAGTIAAIVARNEKVFRTERERHRSAIAARRPTGRGLVIFADSLGLPRPVARGAEPLEDRVYAELIADAATDRAMTSICQRYFTTSHILQELEADPQLAAGADVIIHVGLNDCVNRMFLEDERLSLDLLPEELKTRVVTFSNRHRRAILTDLASRHYVSPEKFSANLDAILVLLKQRKAQRVVLTTIILPPISAWPSTPFINRNFADYNMRIMSAARNHSALLFDLDRHIWRAQHEGALLSDGMHLASEGHRIFAREAMALLPV
ncbi:SGNH/GDSL hydrolase family protein [uncultured Paracoccus sp.]|uniref:SGNH/GDSL hydrolase family protein n=1 Tax=uncultured Paracoccus sp. TaxID=189685 RepID=UPI0026264258|nr:SGNH/GDSL hydrolase family protein [uncultured Paracoccus sp.]